MGPRELQEAPNMSQSHDLLGLPMDYERPEDQLFILVREQLAQNRPQELRRRAKNDFEEDMNQR